MSDPISTSPYSIFRQGDGTVYWAAWCPKCAQQSVQTAVSGNERAACVECKVCGVVVAVNLKGDRDSEQRFERSR
jgi:uncharacterized Zn finger protein